MAGKRTIPSGGIFPRGFSTATSFPWPLVRAANLVILNYGKALIEKNRRPGKVRVYGTNGQCGWHDESLRRGPGVILGRKGQGPLSVEWCSGSFWVIDTAYFVSKKTEELDLKYFYYLVKYIGLNHLKDGTSNPSLSRGTFDSLLLPFPPLETQKSISSILTLLDEKIELNRRMNETLGGVARAIFKSWFVDFDPVRAKMDGQKPVGMDADTAKLFPDRFRDTSEGKIPDGWRFCKLADAAKVNPAQIGKDYPYTEIEYVDISSVIVGRLGDTTSYDLTHAPSRAKRLVSHGDTIWSCVRPNRKSFLFIHEPRDNLVVSTGFAVLSPRSVPACYLYEWVVTDEFVDYLTRNAHGSAYPAVRADTFERADVLVPPESVLEAFERAVFSMRDRVAHNERESLTLAGLRDALLPKLLSGEIRVADAEKLVEAAL